MRLAIKTLFKTIFIFCLFQNSSLAQNRAKIISLKEAVNIGLQQNISIRQAKNNLLTFETEKLSSRLAYAPTVNANVQALRQVGLQFQQVEDGFEIINETADNLSAGLTANLSLFNGLGRVHQLKIAEYNLKAAQADVESTQQQMILDVCQQYLQLLLDNELLIIAQRNIKNQNDQLKRIKGFADAGIRPQSDYFTQKSIVKNLELNYVQVENNYQTDKAIFANLLFLDPLLDFTLDTTNLAIDKSLLQHNLSALFDIAIENRPDLIRLRLQSKASKRTISSNQGSYLPELSAFYRYGTQYSSLNQLSFDRQFLDLYPTNTVGLNLSIPLFNNHVSKVNVTRAKVSFENNKLQVKALERKIFQEIQTAYLNFIAAEKSLEASYTAREAAEEAYQMQFARYEEGMSNLAELALANQQKVTASSEVQQAYYTFVFQDVILKYQLGNLQINSFY